MESWGVLQWTAAGTAGSALVAVLALVRPELERALRRWRGRLEVYDLGETVEIGYGAAGPIVGLDLNLRAVHRDFFVATAEARVTRLSDGATHLLPWGGFRQPGALFPGAPAPYVETPAGFELQTGQARRINVAFADRETRDKMLAVLLPLRKGFQELLAEAGVAADPEAMQSIQANFDKVYAALSKQDDWREAWTELQRLCYWTPGEYEVVLRIQCSDPSTEVRRTYRFALSKEESDALFGNAVVMQRQNVGMLDWHLHFANPKFSVVEAADGVRPNG
jgi:hypothetical protein